MRRQFQIAAVMSAALFSSGVQALSKITRGGRYLYDDSGNRFYIKGVAYQEQGVIGDNAFLEPTSFIDPLANGTNCARDLPYLQQLGVNTIRVYSVNSSLNHDACMNAFSNAGIYAIIDLSLPVNGSIDSTSPSWSTNLLDLYLDTIDAFSSYNNVLAYNVGNEVVIASNGTAVSAYIKAAARDVKAYLQSKSSSALVGYAAIDGDVTWRNPMASYLACDPSSKNSGSTSIDLYGLNNYEWCGNSTFDQAYSSTEGDFAGFNVPAYFSEFGCITSPPRVWTEVAALLSSEMSSVWSGGVAFSYFPATSIQGQFGMVNISTNGSSVTPNNDFTLLAAQYTAATPPNSPSSSSAGSTSYPSCPQANSTFLASDVIPPTPNLAACSCLDKSLSCQFTPATNNYSGIVGSLIDTACGLLGQQGGNCNEIAGNGATGVYGAVAGCDPTVQVAFAFSEYFEANNRNPQACSFAGNGTVNPLAPTTVSAANSAASSCISSPSATFTPTAPPNSGSTNTSSTSTATSRKSGAVIMVVDRMPLMGLGAILAVGLASFFWILA